MTESDAEVGELSLMDRGIKSLAEIPLSSQLHTLNLHCNQISRIEGLDHILNLHHLDLSSNCIRRIEGLSSLANLHTLNLSCNLITKIEGLEKLFSLSRLNLSYNRIHDLTGLLYLRGTNYKISYLELHSNCINNVNHLLQCLTGLQYLSHLTLEKNGKSNPLCTAASYREILLQALPQLTILDGKNIFGEPVNIMEANPSDLMCFEGLLDCLASSHSPTEEEETCVNLPVITPRIDQVLAHFRQRTATPSWPTTSASTELVSSSEPETVKLGNDLYNDMRIKKLEDQISHLLEKMTNSSKNHIDLNVIKAKRDTDLTSGSDGEKENSRKVVKRSKLPNYRKATLSTKHRFQRGKVSDSGDKQSSTKSEKLGSQVREEEDSSLLSDVPSLEVVGKSPKKLTGGEKNPVKKLKSIDSSIPEESTYRALIQELDQERERRWKAEQAEKKLRENIKELQCHAKEEKDIQSMAVYTTDRKELEARVSLNGSEFQEAVSKEVAKEQQRHERHIKELEGKISHLCQNYKDLEDEFRIALTIEAKRFAEVKEAFDNVAAELAEHKHVLLQSQQKEKQSATLIQELTSMVKEQKSKITELVKSKQETMCNWKSQIQALESMVEEDKQKTIQLELLKQEKSKLISQITAQESVIDGLKAERKIWGQELAQQGASLAQDRGKLEAKIEVLTNEIETQKKQNERNSDSLKIKSKIVEDQTETIRKLKVALQERDEQIRKHREESTEMEKRLQVQLEEKEAHVDELMEQLERQNERKEELKQQLQQKDKELEDTKKAYSAMNKKWQDKGGLLSKLEAQVKQMKDNFDIKEKHLIEEREKSLQSQKATMEKLHSMDDAFRRQLESTLAAHQVELLQLANEKQQQIVAANEKVYQVEEEMRQLLQETASNKKAMEEKIKRLTVALSDIQQEL
ncbi:leucine-rich repeat and coiled-coil domain-containing protein 1 isoform X3 [Eublepharis macularius]|uniref:Leucine-rich repeat and coiled-coil domain-containing protein 1 n=1 Tax=Eublepharis macularius TaxID=481883 RepID=A0AA97L4D5_EUBMA|nr:leucine-rich repeat and coiled-coil domain-containing protein 1 isoform X3 [Eublepharis macularius]